MRMRDLTPRQLTAVACPACGVPPGERCLWRSGSSRTDPHLDRKLIAAEAIEQERVPAGPLRWQNQARKMNRQTYREWLKTCARTRRSNSPNCAFCSMLGRIGQTPAALVSLKSMARPMSTTYFGTPSATKFCSWPPGTVKVKPPSNSWPAQLA